MPRRQFIMVRTGTGARSSGQKGASAAMARLAIGNHAKLSWLLLRGGVRRLAGRVNGHPLLRWPVFPFRTDRLLLAPPDLRTADATCASESIPDALPSPARS